MTAEVLAVLADPGLTDLARVLAFYIASKGQGWHEIPASEFSQVGHGYPSADTIRTHLKQLERAGYIERRAGGKGHADSFHITPTDEVWRNRLARTPQAKALESPVHPKLNDTVVSSEVVSTLPPIVPQLDPRAADALAQHDALLAGCRGALRDYVLTLPARRQWAYVQTVASYLNDIDPSVWRLPSGAWLEKEKRPGVLAVALNELAAGDESKMKRPVGDPGNLKTKINILLREPIRYERKQRSTEGGAGGVAGEVGAETVSLEAHRRRRGFGT
jgi:hypothetical protein